MPEFVEPMLARASTLPVDESGWAFEVKWDGVRAIAHSRSRSIRLLSRNANDVTVAYPELRGLKHALGSHATILDGEIVAFDESGRQSFEALQPRMHVRDEADVRRLARATPVTYVVFDLLWLDGHSLMDLSYSERRLRLDTLKLDGKRWHVPAYHAGQGTALLSATRAQGLEGVIAKRLDSRYVPGGRGGSWLKIKHSQRQEVVIGGWTDGKGSRAAQIGALHIGVYDEQGSLRYAGRVGTGFDQPELERLTGLLGPLARATSPFVGRQPPRGAHFVEPRLVCEVEFTEWTREGLLRHPSYKGLRDDKAAETVLRERVRPPNHSTHSSAAHTTTNLAASIESGHQLRGGVEINLEGRTLKLTNLDKVLYPQSGFTKGDLVAYYAAIAPALLAHLQGRPLTLKRYPDGVDGEFFYEKECPGHRPEWVQTTKVWSETNGGMVNFCLCQDLPTLVWIANLAAIELHPLLALAQAVECPRTIAFDLDPGPPAGIVECCTIALELRDTFAELGMSAFAKTSGAKGVQVYVPLNDEHVSYEQTKPFAHAVADLFRQRHPGLVVSRMAKTRRSGRVLIDWSQNDQHKTTVSVYSLRAKPTPTVSAPVSWREVELCRDKSDAKLLEFGPDDVLRRFEQHGDLFAEVASLHQALPAL